MRMRLLTLSFLATLCACSQHPAPPAAHAVATPPTTSEQIAQLLVQGEYSTVEAAFDDKMQAAVPVDKLRSGWSAMALERGTFQKLEQKHSLHDASGTTDVCLLRFEKGPAELVVNWNNGRVSGMLIHPGDLRTHALSLAELALHGDAAALYAQFSAAMKSALSQDKLTAMLAQVRGGLGPNSHAASLSVVSRSADTVTVLLRGDNGAVDMKMAFTIGTDDLAGLFFAPADTAKADPAPPPYADPSRYHEATIDVVKAGRAPLPATLTLPNASAPVPAAVLVPGSGPQDRDETVGANRPFRDLALGLATRGIAVLRYEKRTFGANAASSSADLTFDEETTDDAVAAAQLLMRTKEVDPRRVFVVGHSQGAMAAPRIAAYEPKVRGLVLLEPPARPIEDLMLDQNRYLAQGRPAAAGELQQLERDVARIKAPDLAKQDPKTLILGAPVSWWLSLRGYSPTEELVKVAKPTLIVQGGRDFQVTGTDLALWTAAISGKPWVTVREMPALNHLLEAGTGPSTPAEYRRPSHVDAAAVSAIADWIAAVPAAP
jgi:pimeloyl-ACP methyl ester carboxylesterase